MKRFIKFGSIGQFRNVIHEIQKITQFQGLDDEGNPIVDYNAKLPTVNVVGSEKIHGTNVAVCYSNLDGLWIQSRKNIIGVGHDKMGGASWALEKKDTWEKLILYLADHYKINLDENIISIYFEWAGGSIQKKSACSGMDKCAIIFQHFRVSPIVPVIINEETGEEKGQWLETKIGQGQGCYVSAPEARIYNIMDYQIWTLDIDFENPNLSKNKMINFVNVLEPNSSFGSSLGIPNNIGEGIVFTFMYRDKLYKFKVKGEKHSKSKVKTLAPVDEEKELAKIEFTNYVCTASRLEQAWQTVFGIEDEEQEPNIKFTGEFIKAVIGDVMKEELDIMEERDLLPKEVNGLIAKLARRWFMDELDKKVGLK